VGFTGASFRFEQEMVEPFLSHLSAVFQLCGGQRARLVREPTVGSMIPDLLLGIWSGELPRLTNLNGVSRHILAWLSTHKCISSEKYLHEDLLISHHAATSAVAALKRVGAIAKRDSGEIELRPEFDVSDSVRLIAIEMKLKRWREALNQAIEYKLFANEAWVVLDGNQVRITDDMQASFVKNGVGLLLQRGSDLVKEISAAPCFPRPSDERYFLVGKLAKSGPYCLA
jgi:hypothetical protein